MRSRFLNHCAVHCRDGAGTECVFPKPSYFRETFSRTVTKVELQAPVKLADFVVPAADGKKLELSLRSFLDLVMANNTDIAVSRLTVDVAQNAITRAFGPFDPFATGRFRYPVENSGQRPIAGRSYFGHCAATRDLRL